MVHKPKHKVHSFRGLLGDGGQDEINLERQNVNLAYRVLKFEGLPEKPFTLDQEDVLKIYREKQTSIDGEINFDDQDLLAALAQKWLSANSLSGVSPTVIFDNILFSRNIYVTHKDVGAGGRTYNYYLEIEEVPVGAATLMQLKLGTARKLIGAKMGA